MEKGTFVVMFKHIYIKRNVTEVFFKPSEHWRETCMRELNRNLRESDREECLLSCFLYQEHTH